MLNYRNSFSCRDTRTPKRRQQAARPARAEREQSTTAHIPAIRKECRGIILESFSKGSTPGEGARLAAVAVAGILRPVIFRLQQELKEAADAARCCETPGHPGRPAECREFCRRRPGKCSIPFVCHYDCYHVISRGLLNEERHFNRCLDFIRSIRDNGGTGRRNPETL